VAGEVSVQDRVKADPVAGCCTGLAEEGERNRWRVRLSKLNDAEPKSKCRGDSATEPLCVFGPKVVAGFTNRIYTVKEQSFDLGTPSRQAC